MSSGRFGTFWVLREVVIVVALVVALYMLFFKKRPQLVNNILPSVNLLLGLMLFIAITMSGHASAVSSNVVVYAILLDWLHLLAAALWVGGMMYIATTYLPVLKRRPIAERPRGRRRRRRARRARAPDTARRTVPIAQSTGFAPGAATAAEPARS